MEHTAHGYHIDGHHVLKYIHDTMASRRGSVSIAVLPKVQGTMATNESEVSSLEHTLLLRGRGITP